MLDTHVWHWWVNQIPSKLSDNLIKIIETSDSIGVSAISCFEMAWLVQHGRIDLGLPFKDWLQQIYREEIIRFLPITPWIAEQAVALPEHHKDPQDRMVIATALYYGSYLISLDEKFRCYRELDGMLFYS